MRTEFRILVDLFILGCVGFPLLLFFIIGKPFERGFNCNDQSLMYPYKHGTIHSGVLYGVGIFLPLISMCIVEQLRLKGNVASTNIKIFGREVHPWLLSIYAAAGPFLFGCCTSHLLVDIAKYSIGRLRPHFVDICKPDWAQIECQDNENFTLYVDPIPCMETDPKKLKAIRLSFPSGHASFSAYTMLYFALYLQARMKFLDLPALIRPFCQIWVLAAAFYTAVSRIHDYKHHWSDVVAGSFLGSVVAVCIALYVSDLFPSLESDFRRLSNKDGEDAVEDNTSSNDGSTALENLQPNTDPRDGVAVNESVQIHSPVSV